MGITDDRGRAYLHPCIDSSRPVGREGGVACYMHTRLCRIIEKKRTTEGSEINSVSTGLPLLEMVTAPETFVKEGTKVAKVMLAV